ncbi:MAG TPA: Calx-beta domain-containing protein, partial [Pyrinomonadaceae bacterium]
MNRTVCAAGCDLPTVAAAVAEVNASVPAGGVTYNVAAGHTETAPAGGYTITATGTATDQIIFQKDPATMGANPVITASNAHVAGSLHDAIFEILGGDFITISGFTMLENPANTVTAAATNTMTEWGVALLYATTTDGAQNVSLLNNTIDLDRTYQNTFGIYSNSTHGATTVTTTATATTAAGGNSGLKVYNNVITDVNNGIVVVGPTTAADNNDGLDIGGASIATTNSITNFGTTGTFSGYANVSGTVNGILVRNTKNFNVSFNTITSSNGGTTAGTLNGIQVPAFTNAPTGTFTNSVNNNIISLRSGAAAGAINGINILGTSASITSTINVNNNDFNNFGHTVAGTAAITFLSQSGAHLNQNVNNNTFTNNTVNTTGSVTFIANSNTNPGTGTKNVNNNSIVTGFTKTGAGGTITFFTDNGSDPLNAVNNVTNNNFSNVTLGGGAAGIAGIANTNGGSPTKNVTGNTVSNINTGGGTGTVTLYSINFDSGTTTVSGNTGNTVTHGGAINGMLFGTSGTGTTNASQNTIHTLTGTGTGTVTGISAGGTTGTTRNIFRNKIYNLENSNAAGAVSGITVSTGATMNVSNNLVGDLRAPNLNATNSLNGINITGGTNVTADFNTVYLNATSAGANFGSNALSASTTPNVTLRNNILVNLSTPNGTGLTVAYRRSTPTLTTYNAASNNNDFYAGVPSATRLIYYDGTNADQTLPQYKVRVSPRDSNSVTENPNFLSTNGADATFLHINPATPTQLESGGTPVAGITTDYDGDTRNATTPDIGADEFTGTPIDLSAPTIIYTPLVNTTSTTNRTITTTITDASGVAGGALSPRIYFRKNGGAYFSTQCVLVSGNSYDCTIDYSLVGGVTTNDVIDYFIVAQDTNGNVGANPNTGFAATDVNNVTSPPSNPNTYTIVAGTTGTLEVGIGNTCGASGTDPCPYQSLTNPGGLFAALNAAALTGNVVIDIRSDLTAETGAVALNQLVEEGANPGTYTVTIKPNGAARVISGANATGGLIRLNGADRVTIDGSLSGGTDRSLTITNTSTSTNTAAIHIASAGAGAGATNNTVKNTNLSCGADQSTSTNVTYGISHGGAALGNSGADNDNNSFINNAITKVNIGIYSSGENAANQVQNTVISNNLIGPAAFGSDQIGRAGIIFNLTNNAQVTGNEVRFVGVLEPQTSSGGSYDKFGIAHAFNGWSDTTFGDLAVSNTLIARNKVHDIVEENTFSAVGIFMAGGNGANDTLNTTVNNFIWNVRANGTSGDNGVSLGIASGRGDTVAFNSIYMAGDLDPGASTTSSQSSFGIQITSTTVVNLNLKDNISFVELTSNTATLKHGAIKIPAAFAWGTGGSNFNDLYAPNAQGIVGRVNVTDAPTLADWQTATGQDANSKSVDPLFVSTTDLHLQSGSTLRGMGNPVAGVTTDIDGDTRNPATPDIGADEFASFVAPTIQFSSATYTGAEGTSATITVTRSGDLSLPSTVGYSTSNGTATGGAACGAGVDYVSAEGVLAFAASETSKTFNVQLCSDALPKGDETINLTLAGPNGATLGTPSTAVLTITNVNAPLAGVFSLSAATYTVGEAGSTVAVTINRTGGTDGEVSVNYGFTDGTATGGNSCAAGIDYNNTGSTVTFAGGQSSQTVNVTICNDTAIEGSETFTVTLSGATGGATIGSPSSAVITITDDDVAQPGTLAFSSATYTVGESAGTATITVNRTGGSDGSVTVDFATVAGGTATGGATCETGIDYVNTSGTLTFANGVTSQAFMVTICPDATPKANETINLMLSNATGGATIGAQNTAVLTITDDDAPPAGNVVVNPGNVAYVTLGEAIAAINAGTHTGAVTVDINASTTETGAIVLNASGAGAASYTSIVIRPMADGVTVAGPTIAGRGLIELNGADNVTIDGDNPNTGGTNRNLTLQNTAANTVNFTSVIRIALAATVNNTADNDIFRNLNIVGSSTGRNIAAATSTTASENTTFGILAGPGASTVSTTTAPNAITSVSTGVGAGATATNLTVNNNSVVTAARAISINGSATSVFPGLQITGNLIGNPVAGEVNQVTAIGITAQGSTNAVIADNTIWVEGFIASSASTHGINVGVNSTAITGATIERNRVNRVRNNNPSSWSAFGINLGGGNSHIVRNNFVSGVINDQTTGTGAFGTTFGAYGIRVAAGTGHQIYHNSVHLYGMMPGVTSTNLTAAFLIVANTQTGLDVRNNIFSNQITGGNPTGTRHVAIALPSGGTSAVNLTLNNNAYYQGTDANSRLAQVGTTFGTGEFLAENFDPTSTTPASNFRAYTSTLSAAGTNDNASFATAGPPPFVSNTDLHIPAGTPTRLESGGAPVGVTTDIDLETRNATTPDIGADEFAGNPPAANDIAAVSILVPVPNSTVTTGTTVSPQARFINAGSAVQTNVMVQFTITGPGGYNYTDTQTIATINPGQPLVVTFAAAPAFTTVGTYTMTATVLTPDSNPANNQVTGSFQVRSPITGTVTVGTGGDYLSLTNPGGIFADLNLVGASGNVVINIISDLTAETGAVPLNQLAGGFSVTIKPSGAARVISGTAPANTGLIILNGADNVTIDGSLSGGNDRSLTITNNQTGTSTVVWIRSASASNGSNNNTIKNCIINGATGATQTTAGILTGSGVTIGADAEAANSNNTITNNWIYRVQNSMYLRGGLAAANFDQNWVVTGNEMGSTTAGNRNSFRGMLIGNSQNFTISGNLIHGVQSSATTTASMSGIQIGLLVNGGVATNNIIHEIKNVSATGTGANGIHFITTSTASNVTIANNFVYDVTALGSATLTSNGFGINVASGAGYKIYHNSVNLNTNQGSGTTAAMFVNAAVTTAGALDVRNNIFANTQTAGATRYAFYSAAANTVYSAIDFNDYFSTGSVGFLGGARATIEEWRTATGQDANSKAVDPLFVSPTDLHLQAGSPMINMGTTIAGITTDIDGQTRDAMPDIGADEFSVLLPGTLSLSSATYSVPENGGTVTVTVNRTSGTVGAVSVNYTLTNGTATGGAACGAGVDYVNTGGTVNFVEGQSSQTFTVQICDDAVFEGNETFTVTLTNPTGGAILGTPSTATVTIVENDPMPVVPAFSINDVTVVEGDAGMSTATFTVTLTNPNAVASTVQYATANGTATAGIDYVATSGTLTFNPGTTTQTITVTIIG